MVDTWNKSYQNKRKGDPPKTTFVSITSSHQTNAQTTRGSQIPKVISTSYYSSKYNISKQLATTKVDTSLLDMVTIHKTKASKIFYGS